MSAVARLQEHLGYRFADPGLLTRSLTHRSHTSELGEGEHNERLEFLGLVVVSAAEPCKPRRTHPPVALHNERHHVGPWVLHPLLVLHAMRGSTISRSTLSLRGHQYPTRR